MFQQLLAITRNTFFESIRQPIMLVVLVAATVLIVLSNPLSAFTMDDNQRMLVDIGLATVFLAGAVLAAFIATNVLGHAEYCGEPCCRLRGVPFDVQPARVQGQ